MDSWFYQMVNNVVELPRIENNEIVTELSTGVDVVIAHYQLGDFTTLRLEDLSLPILWRPQLHVVFRLFDLKNGHTVESFEYKEKMSWLRYFKRFLAFKLTTPFERHDLEPLFIAGYIRFLKDTKKQGFI